MTLLAIGVQAPPPSTSFTQLRPMMNHGYVTMTGTVINTPELHGNPEAPQSVSFDLADAGGRITVIAAQRTTRDLLAHNKLPDAHSQVQVTGHLYLVAGKPTRLYLDSASSLYMGTPTP